MRIRIMIAAGILAFSAGAAVAQIATGSVDTARQVTLTGIVKSIQWGSLRSLVQLVVTDAAGNVIVTGQFWEQCNFGGGNLIVPSVATGDGFLAKYNAATGAYMSGMQFGGSGNDWGISVTVDGSGNTIVTGTTNGGNFNGTTLTSHGGYDAFLMKLAL